VILLLDNYDSFTHNLSDYLFRIGMDCVVMKNDDARLLQINVADYDAVVISPGPKTPVDAGHLMNFIEKYYTQIPMLGVCLGHQALGILFGAKLVKAARPMHGKTSDIYHHKHDMFLHVPSPFKAMRYHSLVLEEVPSDLFEVTANTAIGETMAIAHRSLPLYGMQFHPESVLSKDGLLLLSNFISLISPKKHQ
jgi:anthranilate synthase/aminodeoxychorismate synthase-like glutamine amidotransferase